MFASLPNTPEVLRAKDELYTMMEDKYNELIAEGKPENEAVGIVISEFGNLEEVSESLGLTTMLQEYTYTDRNQVTLAEAEDYVQQYSQHRFLIGLGVMLFILAPANIIFMSMANLEAIGLMGFFGLIAVGVGIIVYSGISMGKWKYLDEQLCCIDYATANQLKMEKEAGRSMKALFLTIGIALCIISVVPAAVFDSLFKNMILTEGIGPVLLFVFVGMGVLLIVFAGGRETAINKLLGLNDATTVSGSYRKGQDMPERYLTPGMDAFMKSYWTIVTCIYLIWSFMTFNWTTTWIIWPVAAIVKVIIRSIWGAKED